ncbi:MAG: CFI-box-CTERM domain-containing protein [Bdellovibrionales bacterium]|jgi:hypothetical protein|nr:CFI-box-CTERM domain-containing protein [Bdellovibrionales bacterium]
MSDSASTQSIEPSKKKRVAPGSPEEDGVITCPYCGDTVPALAPIEAGMRIGLKEHAKLTSVPESVCPGCYSILAKMVSRGTVLRAEAQAREQNRLLLWRNRVSLVKKAKDALAQKNFAEAAVHYEKYIRILELVYDKKAGDLTPDLFSSEARRQEMTVVASVYWDLMRIYDQSPHYRERQLVAARKLAEFVRFTPIYGHIMRKAEILTKTAKNAEAYRAFVKASNKNRPRCFIASAAFEGYQDPAIETLRLYRDRVLRKSRGGRIATLLYYRTSPSIARLIDRSPSLVRRLLRALLRKVAKLASKALSKAPSKPFSVSIRR